MKGCGGAGFGLASMAVVLAAGHPCAAGGGGLLGPVVDLDPAVLASYVTVGDLNGDGFADLVVPNNDTADLEAFLNLAGASLERQVPAGPPIGSFNPAVLMDVNVDGVLDVLTSPQGKNAIGIRYGNGDGTFGVENQVAIVRPPRSFAIGEVTGDALLDVVVGHLSGVVVTVLRGDGTTLVPDSELASGGVPSFVSLGEVSGDEHLDLLVSNVASQNWRLYRGLNNGGFTTLTTFDADELPIEGHLVDLDGDGNGDVVTTTNNGTLWRRGLGNGTFAAPAPLGRAVSLAFDDLDQDGALDIVGIDRVGGALEVKFQMADGDFDTTSFPGGRTPERPCVGRFDAGCRPSILIGRLSAPMSITTVNVPAGRAADLDCDGVVGRADLMRMIGAWGVCPTAACRADLDGDANVGFGDLSALLAAWDAGGVRKSRPRAAGLFAASEGSGQ